jgi:hypothetical protein
MYNVPSPRGCVRVRISTIPALIVEGDYQGPSSEQYFSHIQDENKFTNKKSERGPWDGSTMATTFDCYVG